MKLYAAASDTNPLDAFVGKDLWIKVIISADDPWFYYDAYVGTDKLFYINIIDVDLTQDRYMVHLCERSFLDPDGYFYGELNAYDLNHTKYISRKFTVLFKPVTILTSDEVLDIIDNSDEEDN